MNTFAFFRTETPVPHRTAFVRNQATVGVYIKGGEHGVLGSIYKEIEEER